MPIVIASEPSFGNPGRPMEKILGKLRQGYSNFYPTEAWTPNVNLYETESAYLVCVDLAGVDKDKIEIDVNDGNLTLRGARAVPMIPTTETQCSSGKVRMHLMEIDHGDFRREVELPEDVRQDQISATYETGLLWIELPKKG